MPDDTKRKPENMIRPGPRFSPVSGVELSVKLTSDVDAWAEARSTSRSDALRQLIELGLSQASDGNSSGSARRDCVEIENMP